MPLATSLLAPFILLLSILALRREIQRRRDLAEAEKSDAEWLDAFEQAAQEADLSPSNSVDQE